MKKIKDTLASLLYRLLLILAKLLPVKSGSNHLLIVKTDEIGDYMLFRNLLKYFKQSEQYKGYRITLIGNDAWKPIFEVYDNDTVDSVIWIAKKRFKRDLKYRFGLLKQTRLLQTSDVINCIFSRSISLDDGFAFVATGSNKVAMKGNNANRGSFVINIDSLIYTSVVDAGNERLFESIRNSNYIKDVLQLPPTLSTRLTVKKQYQLPQSGYFMVFIGAGNKPERKWPVANFVQCAEYIAQKYKLTPVICGGPPDMPDGDIFEKKYNGRLINKVGKTTLPEFIELAGSAKLLLSVDTGPVHMAAAAGCPVVGLFSGVFYGRYAPYPKEAAHPFYSIYPDFIDQLIADDDPKLYGEFTLKNESIRAIQIEKVLPYLDSIVA